ncbi:MlaA family lipoprotein [Limobrevibacterium gyesilva]|uniref:VacJ family lipoprotein n=1 Tax=Limobrevibacterium gyesilva TaxID=2991712 RepID=A0AA42CK94_9PROT|nr:VacJ family lipoprotein [Limobrevibacterium gyesilva]MCW3477605.1 VacJ family lipoprotein [Limobrevibacterium gyesilva]
MRAILQPALLGAVLVMSAAVMGCATPPPASDPDALAEYKENNDPLEPTNRVFYNINNGIDVVILRPIALAYHYVMPETVRTHTHNVLTNLGTPVVLANDMLQGKPRRAGDTLMRMLINSTIGLAGIFDVAGDWGYPQHDSDAGITLAVWGMPDGAYLFLPILGPSNPRDAVGFGVNLLMDPLFYAKGDIATGLSYGRLGLGAIDARERVLTDLDKITAQALDPYATIRSLARQHRHSQIDDAINDKRATNPWPSQPAASQPAVKKTP